MKIGPTEAAVISKHPRISGMSSRWLAQCLLAIEGATNSAVCLWLEAHESLADVEGDPEIVMDGLKGVVFFRDHPVLKFEFFDRPSSVLRLMPRKPTLPLHPYDPAI